MYQIITRRFLHTRIQLNMLLLLLLLLLLVHTPIPQAIAASCGNASTLFQGQDDSNAVVYDDSCNARRFQVVASPTVERSLNLSNLEVVDVHSYPRVFHLYDSVNGLLNDNKLETFMPTTVDNDMKILELASNFIMDLSSVNFPRRLNYLDLSFNSIATLSAATPWPELGELQTLLLHGNSLRSVEADTFTKLTMLHSLSLSSTGISNLDEIVLPTSLQMLNATRNSFTSASTRFSNLPVDLQYLDLSNNLLTEFPIIVSSLTTLVELNLEYNGIKNISGTIFASTLDRVYLGNNPLSSIEICRSDVTVFQSLTEFSAPSSVSSACLNPMAVSEEIQGVSFCVLEDHDCSITRVGDTNLGSQNNTSRGSTSSETFSNSIFSATSVVVIGSTFFLVGILLSALVYGVVWSRRKSNEESPPQCAVLKLNSDCQLGSSGGNIMVFTSSGRFSRVNGKGTDDCCETDSNNENFGGYGFKNPGEAAWSAYESPLDKYHPVALLEPTISSKSYLGANTASLQARSKLKIKVDLDDLLVYEIPPEEIQMRCALHMSSSKKNSKSALALGSVGVGSSRKKVESALFLAEYQGYKVVIQTLTRSKKHLEKRFVEQIRLAASLDHASIVHFIGITTGCSTTASRRRGSSGATIPYVNYGLMNNVNESVASSTVKSRYPNIGAPSWHLGVVFEYMQHGSLATMFESERYRREGKERYLDSSFAPPIVRGNSNIFNWYPVLTNSSTSVNGNPNANWRCKLSFALDVAMGLVYLHANNYAHGRVCARKVLVNEQGEAKLSAMDVLLPSDIVRSHDENYAMADDFRGSLRESARWTMQMITGFRETWLPKASKPQTSGNNLGGSRYANNSGQSDVSGVSDASSATLDNNSLSGDSPVLDKYSDELDEHSLKSSGIGSSLVAAQRDDVYAFGTFLWELDTMISVEEDLASSRVTGISSNPHLLKFSADCPSELQMLARKCWREVPSERPDAIDVQEELVTVLEGRLTTNGQVPVNWTRPSYLSSTSAISSLSSSDLSLKLSSLRSSYSGVMKSRLMANV